MDTFITKDVVKMINDIGLSNTHQFFMEKHISCSSKALWNNLKRTQNKFRNLSRCRHRVKGMNNLHRFLDSPYTFPSDTSDSISATGSRSNSFSSFDEQCPIHSSTYQDVSSQLCNELNELKMQTEETKQTIEQTNALNDSLSKLLELKDIELELKSKEIENKVTELKRTSRRENYWRERNSSTPVCVCDESSFDEIVTLKNEIKSLKQINKNLHTTIHSLQEENEMLQKRNDCSFYDSDKHSFLPELHICVYELLNYNVAVHNVCNVIQSVLKSVNLTADKLPSPSTVANWSVERNLLSRKHVSSLTDKENVTLFTDETSKYDHKYGTFSTRDESGNYMLLGLKDMATKSSHDTLDTFKDILNDLDTSDEKSKAGKTLLSNIKNTMSDRAATEVKFNKLLQDYKSEVLPDIIEKFDSLNDDAQQSVTRINNFFCGLHSLVHMAEVAQKSLFQIEKDHFEEPLPSSDTFNINQSGTFRLIQTSCKAFARRGDQRNGCHGNFKTYISSHLQKHKMNFPLQPLKGNRFNILFSNAGYVYFLHSEILEFLKQFNSNNSLLKSILHDVQEPFYIAGCKALGLISKFITTPLWNVLENKDIHICDMNIRYLQLVNFLNDSSLNIKDFICGKLSLFDDVPIKQDAVFSSLIEPADIDVHVEVILSIILPALSKLIQFQYRDHLPGGIHENMDRNQTKSVDKHNKFSESVFAHTDRILSTKPNISSLTMESHIAFSVNKTSEWLNEQSDVKVLIEECRKNVRKEKQMFKERENYIKTKRLENLQNEMEKKKAIEIRRNSRLQKTTKSMSKYGFWQTEEEVNKKLLKMKLPKDRLTALKSQIKFRKDVLKQKSEKNIFAFSKVVNSKRVLLSVEELRNNLIKLIILNNVN